MASMATKRIVNDHESSRGSNLMAFGVRDIHKREKETTNGTICIEIFLK